MRGRTFHAQSFICEIRGAATQFTVSVIYVCAYVCQRFCWRESERDREIEREGMRGGFCLPAN